MKPADVISNTYIDSGKEINNKDPIFKIGDTVRISKYKNIFLKAYTPNQSREAFRLKKLKILYRGHILLMTVLKKKLLERFMKRIAKSKLQKEFRFEKVIKKKDNKFYVK